jgi:formiminotetrahydrofolate cyclodeaminase
VSWSEIVGLVPESALPHNPVETLLLTQFRSSQVLERRLQAVLPGVTPVRELLASIAAPSSSPGGGLVTAHAAALAASLVRMVAGLTEAAGDDAGLKGTMSEAAAEAETLSEDLLHLGQRDALDYAELTAALRLSRTSELSSTAGKDAVANAAQRAIDTPLNIARASARLARLLGVIAAQCSRRALPDCAVAASLCITACRGSLDNIVANGAFLGDSRRARAAAEEGAALLEAAESVNQMIRGAMDGALPLQAPPGTS